MTTIKYKINGTWTDIKNIVWPKGSNAPTDLSGANLGGGTWKQINRPYLKWTAVQDNTGDTYNSTWKKIAAHSSTGGYTVTIGGETLSSAISGNSDNAENSLFKKTGLTMYSKKDYALLLSTYFLVQLKSVFTFYPLIKYYAGSTDGMKEYAGSISIISASTGYTNMWLNGSATCIFTPFGGQTELQVGARTNTSSNQTIPMSAFSNVEFVPIARASYWVKNTL